MKQRLIAAIAIGCLTMVACNKDNDNNRSLETVFEDNTYQFTGLAKEEGGRLFVNYPYWSDRYQYALVQTQGLNGKTPYPNAAMNSWQPGQAGADKWVCVQSVYIDDGGALWVVDPANPKMKTVQGGGPKLVRMNKATNAVEKTYFLTSIVPDTAYVNDVQIDVPRQFAYLTESRAGGIIVLNLATGQMRNVLTTHYSVKSDPAYKYIIDGQELMKDGRPAKFNADGIALSPAGDWLYYKPATDDKLYRIRTEALRDPAMTDAALASKVEDLGHFAASDGMVFDKNNNLYLSDAQNYRVVKIDSGLKMTDLVKDDKLIWPDSFSMAEGYLYVSCSQIQKQPEYNNGIDKRTTPHTIYRIKLP